MTDNEIIKALDEWREAIKDDYKRLQLLDAPMDCFEESHTANFLLLSNAIDLINRQQAEIERLQELLNGWKTEAYKVADEKDKLYCEAFERVKTIKAEVPKEFAKKIRQKIVVMVCSPDLLTLDDYDKCIDDVLKEMEE